MEEIRKRPALETAEEVDGKRPKTPVRYEDTCDEDEDGLTAWLSVDDETANELAKLLETEISSPVKVKFADVDSYTWPLIFQSSSSSYVTINGNEESCGSSFSDLDSSVMVNVDKRSIGNIGIESFPKWFAAGGGGDPLGLDDDEKAAEKVEEYREGSSVNGPDCLDCDDEMLARFLGEDTDICKYLK